MNIPDEAVEALQKAEEETDPAWATYWTQRSQALSQIALVEAQEAANELARIANLIALAGMEFPDGRTHYPHLVTHPVGEYGSVIKPEIARTLGLEVAE